MMKKMGFVLLMSLACNLNSTLVTAHEVWAKKAILIQFGEPGAQQLDAYKPSQILDLTAINLTGAAMEVTAQPIGDASVVVNHAEAVSPAAVFFTMKLNPYVINGDDWKQSTEAEAAQAKKSWVGSYTVTSIFDWHPSLTEPFKRHIELIPLKDPSTLKVGESLPLRAYRNGKPAKGVSISLGEGGPSVVSDKGGNLSVPIKAGHQIILGNVDEEKNGHTTGHMTVLSFHHR